MDAFDRQILKEIDAEERKCLVRAERAGRSLFRVKSQWDKIRKDMSGVRTDLYKRRIGVNADLLWPRSQQTRAPKRRVVRPLPRPRSGFLGRLVESVFG